MGCDGGTIPKRDELVRTKKKKEQKDRVSERVYRWKYCSLSQTPLKSPVVACELGRLYNKEEVITRLLSKTQAESNIGHIRGLKDIKELKLTANPSYSAAAEEQKGGQSVEDTMARWICPVAGIEMNGKHGFAFPWTCQCVLSLRALNEVKSDVCCKCGATFSPIDLITLNPSEAELAILEAAMEERREKAKLAKKSAKRKASEGEQVKEKTDKKQKMVNKDASSSGASGSSKAGTSVSGLASSILKDTEFSSVRSKDFSVANNPNHSEVYKSIFDTHKSAKNKAKSHWVTCNPLYY